MSDQTFDASVVGSGISGGWAAKAIGNSTTVMRELNKQTGEISSIVGTINIIAERTNLLSLNASMKVLP